MTVVSTPNRKINVADEEKLRKCGSHGQAACIGGERIYDPQKGKTCHQCRHRRIDFGPPCTSTKGNKECTIRFCHKCLLNRYGEKIEEVAMLNDWQCPKCRGICNCSKCMKKSGHKPTGVLIHTAKQNGFSVSPVSPVNMGDYKMENTVDASLVKPPSLKKELMIDLPRKPGKENSFNENIDSKLDSHNTSPFSKKKNKKSMKTKGERVEEFSNVSKDDDVTLKKSGHKKCGIHKEVIKNEVSSNGKDKRGGLKEGSNDNHDSCLKQCGHKKSRIPDEVSKIEVNVNGKDEGHSVKKTKREGLEEVSNDKGEDDASLNRISGEVCKNEVSSNLEDEGHSVKKKKSKKTKRERPKEDSDGNKDDDASLKNRCHKKCGISEEVSKTEGNSNGMDGAQSIKITRSKKRKRELPKEFSNDNDGDDANLMEGPEKVDNYRDDDASLKRISGKVSKSEVSSSGKDEGHSVKKKKSKKTKVERLEKVSSGNGNDDACLSRISEGVSNKEVLINLKDEGHSVKKR